LDMSGFTKNHLLAIWEGGLSTFEGIKHIPKLVLCIAEDFATATACEESAEVA
jgi:hypothetical protein